MKTTIEIDAELLTRAKRKALDTGTSLKAVFEAALAAHLGGASVPMPLRMVVFGPENGAVLNTVPVSSLPEDQDSFWEQYRP